MATLAELELGHRRRKNLQAASAWAVPKAVGQACLEQERARPQQALKEKRQQQQVGEGVWSSLIH
jgi:hypothetical protein